MPCPLSPWEAGVRSLSLCRIVIVYRITKTIIEIPNFFRFDMYIPRYIYLEVYIAEQYIQSVGTISNTSVYGVPFIIRSTTTSKCYHHFYFLAQVVPVGGLQRSSGQAAVTGVVHSPWYVPSFLSRIGFSIPTARRFSSNKRGMFGMLLYNPTLSLALSANHFLTRKSLYESL